MTLKNQIAESIKLYTSNKGFTEYTDCADDIVNRIIQEIEGKKIKCIALKRGHCGNGWSCSACDKNRFIDGIIDMLKRGE